jgi:hypothetical protein
LLCFSLLIGVRLLLHRGSLARTVAPGSSAPSSALDAQGSSS